MRLENARGRRFREPASGFRGLARRPGRREARDFRFRLPQALRWCRRSAEPTATGQRVTPGAGVMAAVDSILAATGSPAAVPPEKPEGAGSSSDPERNCVGSSLPEASPPAPEPSSPNAAVPTPRAAASAALELPFRPAPVSAAPQAEAEARSTPGPAGSRLGPETFRQRFRQFRYQDAAGPREAFRQLRELSRQWLRPDIRTKEQIVEMLVQEQLLAILPEAARARRIRRRTDVRITG
ncbi:SCAN domain-containing protein 1 [Symphalangus syndactylus]|uniref:SCAN domain-containing protein 1 n=1 Tax=Symphalangus syndactylus TaxID=9590 RepID=UPI002441BD1B|nr:SCAN domain-containing protein 1 [Symphalangus syndactylus]